MARTLTAAQINRIASALERGHYLVAGDHVTFVDKDGVEYEDLLCLYYDLDLESAEGVVVNLTGVKDHGEREIVFLKTYLNERAVTISIDGHFLIEDERWDFSKDEPKREAIVPLAGIQNMLACRVRRVPELDLTTPTDDGFYWGSTPPPEDPEPEGMG